MLFVDKEQVKVTKFPNGELLVDTTLLRKLKDSETRSERLLYKYDGSDSIQELMLACDYLGDADYLLIISYLPYERMDRVQEDNCYSLQTFMKQLQAVYQGKGYIQIYEVHSHVTQEPIKDKTRRVCISERLAIEVIEQSDVDVICYPDKGARKRFNLLGEDADKPQIYCEKIRDFSTGKIMGLDLVTDGYDVTGKHVLIVDDLCSAGGTFYYTAQKLREAGASKVDLVVTHMENNVLNGKILQTTDEKTVIDHIYCMSTMGNMDELGILQVAKNLTVYDVIEYAFNKPGDRIKEITLDKEDVKNYVGHAI